MNGDAGLFVGLMSGTSVDAIDSALVQCGSNGATLVATHEHPIPAHFKGEIAALSHPGDNEIQRMGTLDRELGALFAEATIELLQQANTQPGNVCAIGSHGQTIRHIPPSSATSPATAFSLQIGDPNTIAEITGITTVADFRRRDVAAGGEGAPLAPAFHRGAFAESGSIRAIVNIGGIANATLLQGQTLLAGFDTGPGNTLLDHWYRQHEHGAFDAAGSWAARGRVHDALLRALLAHPYFTRTGPRSTGKEAFHLNWLTTTLLEFDPIDPVDIQATLTELTATSIAQAVQAGSPQPDQIFICGGGAHNDFLMQRLAALLAPAAVADTSALGIPPDWVEAVTFAWLASETLAARAGNAAQVTGASGGRVLGAIYQA